MSFLTNPSICGIICSMTEDNFMKYLKGRRKTYADILQLMYWNDPKENKYTFLVDLLDRIIHQYDKFVKGEDCGVDDSTG